MAKLTVKISTFFKKSTQQARELPPNEKVLVDVGDTLHYNPNTLKSEGVHYRVDLEEQIAPWGQTGYFYKPAVQLEMNDSQKIVALAEEHLGEEYIFGARAQFVNSNYKGPWDCAEFVSWCVYQTTGILYGTSNNSNPRVADAYTGYWLDQARRDHRTVSIADAVRIPGAIVVRHSNNSGHIVISDGQGGTIEARGRAYGVVRYTLSGRNWDAGILVPGVQYSSAWDERALRLAAPAASSPPDTLIRFTSPLTCGPSVARLQQALKDHGIDPGPIDGIFGYQTSAAVTTFQIKHGLIPDGEVGVETLKALNLELN
jgi:hypothetical protein